jgi:hypothetical protein
LPIKSSRLTCTRSNCVRNARNVASAMRPLPNRSRKTVLFVTELLQSLGNGHANAREPRRNRSQQRKINNHDRGILPADFYPPPRFEPGVASKRRAELRSEVSQGPCVLQQVHAGQFGAVAARARKKAEGRRKKEKTEVWTASRATFVARDVCEVVRKVARPTKKGE